MGGWGHTASCDCQASGTDEACVQSTGLRVPASGDRNTAWPLLKANPCQSRRPLRQGVGVRGTGSGARGWGRGKLYVEPEPDAAESLPGTYSLKCHDCWDINNFNCPQIRTCPYHIRRCLTISIRKYCFLTPSDFVSLSPGNQSVLSLHRA